MAWAFAYHLLLEGRPAPGLPVSHFLQAQSNNCVPGEFRGVHACLSLRLCSPVKHKASPHPQHSGTQKPPFCPSPTDQLMQHFLQIFPSPVCLNGDLLEVSWGRFFPQSFLKVRKVFCFVPYVLRLRSRKSIFLAPYCWLLSISFPPTWNCSLLPLSWTCHFPHLFWLLLIQGIREPLAPCSSPPQPCHHSVASALPGDPPHTLTSRFSSPSLQLSPHLHGGPSTFVHNTSNCSLSETFNYYLLPSNQLTCSVAILILPYE